MQLGLPETLFYCTEPDQLAFSSTNFPIAIPKGGKIHTGTLRNSLYVNCFRHCNLDHPLSVVIDARGSFLVRIYVETNNGDVELQKSVNINNNSGTTCIPFARLPANQCINRYFIELESHGVILNSMYYALNFAREKIRPTIFLVRTYGNTTGVLNSLRRVVDSKFWDHIQESKAIFFSSSMFCVYDSTPNSENLLIDEIQKINMNCSAWTGPNFGGGGNASINLYLSKLSKAEYFKPNNTMSSECDFVILDDDVCASPETLYRVFAFNQLKRSDVTFGAPIFMDSEPCRLWENGGTWGKEYLAGSTEITSVTPQLINHGWLFKKYQNLHRFGLESMPDYVTFNLISFSSETQDEIGYPAAFFLRGDDVDYSLRCKKNGILLSNPNLAVWQEPAHSYWQEYMAYMHGLIINIVHGDWDYLKVKTSLVDRIHDHAMHHDMFGVCLYSKIVEDLSSPKLLFSELFDELYLMRKKEFAEIEAKFSNSCNPHQRSDRDNIQIISFVHSMSVPDKSKHLVALYWPSRKSYYIYKRNDRSNISAVHELALQTFALLQTWDANFDLAIKDQIFKYHSTTTETFWSNLLASKSYSCAVSSRYQKEPIKEIVTPSCPSTDTLVLEKKVYPNGMSKLQYEILLQTFDPIRYLELNPDVRAANVDPLKHYLKYGYKEKRSLV